MGAPPCKPTKKIKKKKTTTKKKRASTSGKPKPLFRKVQGWKGVFCRHCLSGEKKYFSLISIKGKKIYNGTFNTPEQCAREYDKLIYKHRGSSAKLNFPEEL